MNGLKLEDVIAANDIINNKHATALAKVNPKLVKLLK